MWRIVFAKQAVKDAKKLKSAGLDTKAKKILLALEADPFGKPPAYEALVGNLSGLYSRRINIQHRIVYQVFREPCEHDGRSFEGTIKVVRMWSHYDGI